MERRWHWGINSLRFWFVSSSKIMYYHMDECMKYSEKHEGKGALFSCLISLPCPPASCSCSLCSNFRLTDSEQQALFRRGGAGRCNEARHMLSGCAMPPLLLSFCCCCCPQLLRSALVPRLGGSRQSLWGPIRDPTLPFQGHCHSITTTPYSSLKTLKGVYLRKL